MRRDAEALEVDGDALPRDVHGRQPFGGAVGLLHGGAGVNLERHDRLHLRRVVRHGLLDGAWLALRCWDEAAGFTASP